MLLGQELTHTVTTTVTAEKQHVLNTTILKDGEDVVLRTEHEVNIPIGATYNIEIEGDVNSKTIARSLNVVNNLIGNNAFSFENRTDSTDTGLAVFTANYDPETLTFSGTAPLDSTVRIVFENGNSIKLQPLSDSTWLQEIEETQLEYGLNNIVLVNGSADSQIVVINIDRLRPVEPFTPGFEFAVAANGLSISGIVEDVRATIQIQAGGLNVEVKPKADLTWTYAFANKLMHGQEVNISNIYEEEVIEEENTYFYENSAEVDQTDGSSIVGTANPLSQIEVTATGYGVLAEVADENGEWSIDLEDGLVNGTVLLVRVNGVLFMDITYTGPSNVQYGLSVKIVSDTKIEGTALPSAVVTIIAAGGQPYDVVSNELGVWSSTLTAPLTEGQTVYVSSNGETDEVIYSTVPVVPTDPVDPDAPQTSDFTAIILDETTVQGTGDSGEMVTVTVNGTNHTTTVNADGDWSVTLPAPLIPTDVVIATNGLVTVELSPAPEATG